MFVLTVPPPEESRKAVRKFKVHQEEKREERSRPFLYPATPVIQGHGSGGRQTATDKRKTKVMS